MAQKNRPTLKQQFSDFINRIAPFDGNPLIQKPEHLQVTDDLFDSLLNKVDSSVLINSPADLIALDFESVDLYRINTSGSVDTNFVFTPSNIGTGQIGRIDIIKKSNDTFSFSNAVLAPINNLNQNGVVLSFWVHNINGTYIVGSALNIAKSDNINDNNSDQLATSKAVRDLKVEKDSEVSNLQGSKADKVIDIATSGGLQGGGNLSANRNLSIADAGVTAAKLASGASVANIGYTPASAEQNVADLNDIEKQGIHQPTSAAANRPIGVSNTFFNMVLQTGSVGGSLSQLFFDISSGLVYSRTKFGAAAWSGWLQILP